MLLCIMVNGYGMYRAEIKRIWVTQTPPPLYGAEYLCTIFVKKILCPQISLCCIGFQGYVIDGINEINE